MNWNLILNFLAAMLAIVNPVGLIPVWQEMTADAKPGVRKRIAYMITGTSFGVLVVFLVLGEPLLNFFSIDVAVFKIAGGILLLLTAISMIKGTATSLEDRDEKGESSMDLAKQRFRKVLVPLAVPMLSGPGSLTTAILYSSKAGSFLEYLSLAVIMLLVFVMLCLVFAYSFKIESKVDGLFFVGFTRIFGMIVAAIAVQFIVEGIGTTFPTLTEGSSVLQPGPAEH